MGWKFFTIFITNQNDTNYEATFEKLNLGSFKRVRKTTLDKCLGYPKALYAGNYNGNLIIIDEKLPFEFFKKEPAITELAFINAFPKSEIASLFIQTSGSAYGYAIIQDRYRVRVKEGADGKIYNEFGNLLPEEIIIKNGKIFEEEELEEMRDLEKLSEDKIKARIDSEAGFRTPFALTKRYLGTEINQIGIDKNEIVMYEFEKISIIHPKPKSKNKHIYHLKTLIVSLWKQLKKTFNN